MICVHQTKEPITHHKPSTDYQTPVELQHWFGQDNLEYTISLYCPIRVKVSVHFTLQCEIVLCHRVDNCYVKLINLLHISDTLYIVDHIAASSLATVSFVRSTGRTLSPYITVCEMLDCYRDNKC